MATYESNLNSVLSTFYSNIDTAMEQCGQAGTVMIKAEAPVDTGELQKNQDFERQTNDSVTFLNDTEYAAFQEFGTYKMNANPFFRRGINNSLSMFTDIIVRNMKI